MVAIENHDMHIPFHVGNKTRKVIFALTLSVICFLEEQLIKNMLSTVKLFEM